MSIARLSSLAALLLGLVTALIIFNMPLAQTGLSSIFGEAIASLISGDRLVRAAAAIAGFGMIFGLVAFASKLHFLAQPLSKAENRLIDLNAHGGVLSVDDSLSVITELTSLRKELTPVRAQLSANMASTGTAMVSADALADRVVPLWLVRAVTASLVGLAFVMLVWGAATGANAQALNALDGSYGHPAGMLIGIRSGGFAFIICMIGTIFCFVMATAGHGFALASARGFKAALGATSQNANQGLVPVLNLGTSATADASSEIKSALTQLTHMQESHLSSLATLVNSSMSNLQAVPASVQALEAKLTDKLAERDRDYIVQRDNEQALLKETTGILGDLKNTLSTMQNQPRLSPLSAPLTANPQVAERLSSAFKNLQAATGE
jgi:hypothetical protein